MLTVAFLYIRARSGIANGAVEVPGWRQILLHIGYLVSFSNYQWLSIVFWTLAIEFQFYLSFSLLFTWFVKNQYARWVISLLFILLYFLSRTEFQFFYWCPVFMLGINLALFKKGKISKIELFSAATLLSAILIYKLGDVVWIFSIIPFFIIYFQPVIKSAILDFFGRISYSLYLLHTLVAFAIINLGIRFTTHEWQRILFVSLAIGLTISASFLLYYFVERPCQRLASSIKYRK